VSQAYLRVMPSVLKNFEPKRIYEKLGILNHQTKYL